jgi:imidazole glycerol-phosphate synthase subunit HisF
MISTRVMPCLSLKGRGLVKTVRFKDPKYLGDPRNAVKIFNEREVDELILLDITATVENRAPQFDLIEEIVSEAFMPVAYGGGLRTIEDIRRVLALGVEKAVLCTQAIENPALVEEAARQFGSSTIGVCMDVKRSFFGKYEIYGHGGRKASGLNPVGFAKRMEALGVGELIVNSIDRDGSMSGYDIELLKAVTSVVDVPVIACGGAGRLEDFAEAVNSAHVSAVAAGSLFVFHGRHRAVLINFPSLTELRRVLRQ